jgi:hypothetical protein
VKIFYRIIELVNENLIYCLPTIILTLLFFQVFFKEKSRFKNAYQIIKWIIIVYGIVNLISFLIGIILFPEKSDLFNQTIGKYWLNYWLMMFTAVILPLSLLYEKIGIKPFYLLFVSIITKIGWYFHFYVVLIASHNSYQYWTKTETNWLNSPWSRFYMTWMQGFILALILIGIIKMIEKKKTVHNTV